MKKMKKIILLLTVLMAFSCGDKEIEVKRIQFTSSSEVAKALMDKVLFNQEARRGWFNSVNEDLIDSILTIDPNFAMAKLFDNNGTREENRQSVIFAYENINNVTELEAGVIKANYERIINGNIKKQDKIMDDLINKFPGYYQLHEWSGDIKNSLDVRQSEKRWEEALEINPDAFGSIMNLSALHYPTGINFQMLIENERDLDKAEKLLIRAQKILPNSSRPSRFLGNVYRAKNDFEKSLASYNKSLELIEKYEEGATSSSYANSLLVAGHVYTFQGKYEEGRKYYEQVINIHTNNSRLNNVSGAGVMLAETYVYEKDFSNAVSYLSELQEKIKSFDGETDLQKNGNLTYIEWEKFLYFGHSQKKEETLKSINKIKGFRDRRLEMILPTAIDERDKERINLNNSAENISLDIWYNILFGNYLEARNLLEDFSVIAARRLEFNPNALDEYHNYSGYLNLMEGKPQEAIDSYSRVTKEVLGDDNYHQYFLALAYKAIGNDELSSSMFTKLANDNFATWQNAIVKNLAKSQIQVNL